MAIRRMHDIRTLSGRVNRIANPYMAYMQITCLEMEKARKGKEKQSALQRLQTLDARLCQVEAEKAALLRALTEHGAAPAAAEANGESRLAPARRASGIKLRY